MDVVASVSGDIVTVGVPSAPSTAETRYGVKNNKSPASDMALTGLNGRTLTVSSRPL